MPETNLLPGLIVKAQSGIFDVETEQGIIPSKLRGRLMKERMESDAAALGDRDQAVFVFACADPEPNFRMLDRLLVVAEREEIPALICANKIDLVVPRTAKHAFGIYPKLGYPVLYTSATTGKGIRAVRKALQGKM